MKNEIIEQGRKYEEVLKDKSILELVDMTMYLDGIKPYVELSHNGEVGEFFEKKYGDIFIHTRKDFDSFYNSLTDRIMELADTDQRAKIFLEQTKYQKELTELPTLLNKLEKINLNELKPKFEAVMEYVYDAAINNGFSMDNEIAKIYLSNKKVHLNMGGKTFFGLGNTEFCLFKKGRQNQDDLRIKLYRLTGYRIISPILTTKKMLEKFSESLLNPIREYDAENLNYQIKHLLLLPRIMNEYLKTKISFLENCINNLNT